VAGEFCSCPECTTPDVCIAGCDCARRVQAISKAVQAFGGTMRQIEQDALERAARDKLAAFGALVLKAHRNDGEPVDMDGGDLQAMGEKAGVLEQRTMTEPCGHDCACAMFGGLPGRCFFVPDDVAALMEG
jgi:hypothetical protein